MILRVPNGRNLYCTCAVLLPTGSIETLDSNLYGRSVDRSVYSKLDVDHSAMKFP